MGSSRAAFPLSDHRGTTSASKPTFRNEKWEKRVPKGNHQVLPQLRRRYAGRDSPVRSAVSARFWYKLVLACSEYDCALWRFRGGRLKKGRTLEELVREQRHQR